MNYHPQYYEIKLSFQLNLEIRLKSKPPQNNFIPDAKDDWLSQGEIVNHSGKEARIVWVVNK